MTVARCTVERLQRSVGLRRVPRGKVVHAIIGDAATARPLAPSFGNSRSTAPTSGDDRFSLMCRPGRIGDGLYAAFVINVFVGRIVGWRVCNSVRRDLARCPAVTINGPYKAGLIHRRAR